MIGSAAPSPPRAACAPRSDNVKADHEWIDAIIMDGLEPLMTRLVLPSVEPGIRDPAGLHPANDLICWCRLRGLNSRPSVYKTAALPLS
jgi:hypothetical protein